MNSSSIETEYAELVERYKRFRSINKKLHSALINYLPEKALRKCAKRLGISKSGVFVFQEQHEVDVLMDYCIYDYFESGENAVRRYMVKNQPDPDSDESIVLRTMLDSFYTLVQVEHIIEGVGIQVHDILSDSKSLLVDIGFSETAVEGLVIATRIIPFEDFIMTSGTALPINADILAEIMDLLTKRFDGGPEKFRDYSAEQKADLSASVIHLCLEADASSGIAYKEIEKNPEVIPFPGTNSRVGRNAPCPCGSGRKYKRCCGR